MVKYILEQQRYIHEVIIDIFRILKPFTFRFECKATLIFINFLIAGMSLLSMCINLIQEQMVMKFRWMAKELGMTGANEEYMAMLRSKVINSLGWQWRCSGAR